MTPGRPEGFPEPVGQRLPKRALVRRGSEIRQILREGRRVRTHSLDVYVMKSLVGRPRMGFVVPKWGQRIVDRNRLKRRLREVARRRALAALLNARKSLDVLVRARRSAYQATGPQLESELMGIVEGLCSARC